jgi:hypothetical protein
VTEPGDKVPYDESAWERIVADLGEEMPSLPQPPAEPPPAQPPAAEPEDEFVPPEPPPLPRLDLVSRLAWAGTLGVVGPTVVTLGVMAFVAGFLTLVLRSPNEPEDGWDDGSAV